MREPFKPGDVVQLDPAATEKTYGSHFDFDPTCLYVVESVWEDTRTTPAMLRRLCANCTERAESDTIGAPFLTPCLRLVWRP